MSQYKRDVHLYEVLEKIRTRTPLYLKTRSISELRTFLDGYFEACDTFNVKFEIMDALLPLPFGCFTSYVACRFGSGHSFGWCTIILNQTAQDEEKGFQLFYTLLEEFKQLRVSKCFAADLSEANITHHNSDKAPKYVTGENGDVREPLYKNPVKVFYAELADDAEHKSYIGVVETDTESFISGLPLILFRTEKNILADFKICFGTIAWRKQNQDNIPLRYAQETEI